MGNLSASPGMEESAALTLSIVGSFLESSSLSMRQVEAVIGEVAQSDVPVLLLGEPGSGKGNTAQRIHDLSRRNAKPLSLLSCRNLNPELLAAAHGENEALGGTIFLKEAAELSPACQVYLRDALLRKTELSSANGHSARFICGSAVDLEVEVKARRLREDLYYRISGVCLRLPPLRQRKEDISILMEYFFHKYAQKYERPIPKLSSEARRLFYEYSWPGNLHELEDTSRALVAIGNEHLAMGGLRALLQQKPSAKTDVGSVSLKVASRAASHKAEKELILNVLTRTRWNRRRAAQELQISYKALLYKLKQIGFEGYGAP